jgi:hypothetical protein
MFRRTTRERFSPRPRGTNNMKTTLVVIAVLLGGLSVAQAQADMTCADLTKANAQIDDATKAAMAKDPAAAAMDKKINDYCAKNPTAKASEAMEKAMAD